DAKGALRDVVVEVAHGRSMANVKWKMANGSKAGRLPFSICHLPLSMATAWPSRHRLLLFRSISAFGGASGRGSPHRGASTFGCGSGSSALRALGGTGGRSRSAGGTGNRAF